MSIFGIIGMSALIAALVFFIGLLIASFFDYEELAVGIVCIITAVVLVASIFIGIGLTTESAQVWSAKYEAQKTTIEQSLDSEVLSGLERIELVKQSSELNGELAERQATAELWHVVYYDENVYAGLEPICIN